jgi:hypothetical protein
VIKHLNAYSHSTSSLPQSYWENSSLGEIINKEILRHPNIKNIIENLVNDIPLTFSTLISDFNVNNFTALKAIISNHDKIEIKQDGVDLLFSYLFILGYLTNTSTTNEYVLPNKEIRTEFETRLKDFYNQIFNISPSKFNELTKDISTIFSVQDNREISNIIIKNFAPRLDDIIKKLDVYSANKDGLTTKGVFGNEDLMHSLLNNIAIQVVNAKFASERYTTKPDGSKGRADIVLSKNGKGMVIEMKYNNNSGKSENIEELARKQAKDALEQAHHYNKLVGNDDIKIFIGCNITDTQEVYISGEIVQSGEESIHFHYP